jgi:hypothetical protein
MGIKQALDLTTYLRVLPGELVEVVRPLVGSEHDRVVEEGADPLGALGRGGSAQRVTCSGAHRVTCRRECSHSGR